MNRSARIHVLDTNVLMHDPTALFKFEEHDVYLPMQVIEELDHAKKGTSEASRSARQVSRFINELIEDQGALVGEHVQQVGGARSRMHPAQRLAVDRDDVHGGIALHRQRPREVP